MAKINSVAQTSCHTIVSYREGKGAQTIDKSPSEGEMSDDFS
jgi:hypothetical protein